MAWTLAKASASESAGAASRSRLAGGQRPTIFTWWATFLRAASRAGPSPPRTGRSRWARCCCPSLRRRSSALPRSGKSSGASHSVAAEAVPQELAQHPATKRRTQMLSSVVRVQLLRCKPPTLDARQGKQSSTEVLQRAGPNREQGPTRSNDDCFDYSLTRRERLLHFVQQIGSGSIFASHDQGDARRFMQSAACLSLFLAQLVFIALLLQ
mmetsp:Transcript_55475/g.120830  ORF Transcript_55475/g.120830 Transcript_55475/m.120830 type:complete len:211 (-) Transcript_55475:189-821(-)